jgi:DNA adenine methylase
MVYLGSKSRIAKDIVPIIQKYIDNNNVINYIEPFVGGANVIDKIKCDNKYGSDLSPYIIIFHIGMQCNRTLPESITREEYEKVRKSYNNDTDEYTDFEKAYYGFLASMNGRFFDGGYAVPKGNRNYYQERRKNILNQRENPLYKDVTFMCQPYDFYTGVSNCVIYCDPPYMNTKKYSICKNFDYDKFWNWVRKMSENNIVIVSEQVATPDFKCIWEKETLRSCKSDNKFKATEKLFIWDSKNYTQKQTIKTN